MLVFLLTFIEIVTVLAFVIALVARYWVLRIEPVTLRGIDVRRATDLVAVYVQGVHDHRFAFPTGVFLIDDEHTAPGKVVAQEVNFKGSLGFGLIKYALLLPRMGAAMGGSFGCLGAVIGASAGLMLSLFFIWPIIFIAMIEVVLRFLMRSRIEATIAKAPGREEAVTVAFELHGLSAFGVEAPLRRGMSPGIPERYRAAAGVPAAEAKAAPRSNRLRVIYAVGGGTAALVALAMTLSNPGFESEPTSVADQSSSATEIPSGGSAASDGSGGSDPSLGAEDDDGGATDGTQTGDDATTTAEGSASAPAPMSQADEMERSIRQHWARRLRGDRASLSKAYSVYTPAMQARSGRRGRWIAGIQEDGLHEVEITSSRARLVGRGRGIARTSVRTDADLTGCHRWRFVYRMRRSAGRWRIDGSRVASKRGC